MSSKKQRALVDAVRSGLSELPLRELKKSLKKIDDLDRLDPEGGSLVYRAIEAGRADVVEWLLEAGAAPDRRVLDQAYSLPLQLAVSRAPVSLQIVEALCHYGARADVSMPTGESLLEVARAVDPDREAEVAEIFERYLRVHREV
ncbi:MAG: hypothetical protein H6724_17375 [Sandaracinus sp.]|nr:hypothetical protein [Sandaracinus sp.]